MVFVCPSGSSVEPDTSVTHVCALPVVDSYWNVPGFVGIMSVSTRKRN